MLILSRKPGQSIIIGGIVEVTVAEIRGDQVRIGVTAPRDVPVFRREVIEGHKGQPPPTPDAGAMLELLSRAPGGRPEPRSEPTGTSSAPGMPSTPAPTSPSAPPPAASNRVAEPHAPDRIEGTDDAGKGDAEKGESGKDEPA